MDVLHRSIVLLAAVSIGLSATNAACYRHVAESGLGLRVPTPGRGTIPTRPILAGTMSATCGGAVAHAANSDRGPLLDAPRLNWEPPIPAACGCPGDRRGRGLFADQARPPEHRRKTLLRVQRHGHRRLHVPGDLPASGTGGYSTVLLQLIGSGEINGPLTFDIDTSSVSLDAVAIVRGHHRRELRAVLGRVVVQGPLGVQNPHDVGVVVDRVGRLAGRHVLVGKRRPGAQRPPGDP